MLEAFDQHPVHAGVQLRQHVVHAGLRRLLVFAHQRHAPVGREQHLVGTGLAVAPAVLAFAIHIKVMVGMLDDRDPQPMLLHQHH